MESVVDEDEIEKKAMEEILLETKRAAERARDQGTSGWLNPRIASTNKNFLRRTLVSTLRHPYGSRKRGQFNKSRSHSSDQRTSYHDRPSDGVKSSSTAPESGKPDPGPATQDVPKTGRIAPSWDSPDHYVNNDSESDYGEVKELTSSPPGDDYVYDAYEYSFQAPKDPHRKEKISKELSNHSQSKEQNGKHRRDRCCHTSSSSGRNSKHFSDKNSHRKRKRDSSELSDLESDRKRKHKKKHKHKNKHKSKHHKTKKNKH